MRQAYYMWMAIVCAFSAPLSWLRAQAPEVGHTCVYNCGGSNGGSGGDGSSTKRSGSGSSASYPQWLEDLVKSPHWSGTPHFHSSGFLGLDRTPDDGWVWANTYDEYDLNTIRARAGTPSEKHRHCVWDGAGHLNPAPGFVWCNHNEHNFCVRPIRSGMPVEGWPHVIYDRVGDDGSVSVHTTFGYQWVSEPPTWEDLRTQPIPIGIACNDDGSVIYDGKGGIMPAYGYDWCTHNNPMDTCVKPLPRGAPVRELSNVVANGDGLVHPQQGYVWLHPNKDPTNTSSFDVVQELGFAKDADGTIRMPPGYRWRVNRDSNVSLKPATDYLAVVASSRNKQVIELRRSAADELAELQFANWQLMVEGLNAILSFSGDSRDASPAAEDAMRDAKEHMQKYLEYVEQIEALTVGRAAAEANRALRAQRMYMQTDPTSAFVITTSQITAHGQTAFDDPDGVRVTPQYRLREIQRRDWQGHTVREKHWDIALIAQP